MDIGPPLYDASALLTSNFNMRQSPKALIDALLNLHDTLLEARITYEYGRDLGATNSVEAQCIMQQLPFLRSKPTTEWQYLKCKSQTVYITHSLC